jgi:Zn-dependent protease with chaperone function
MTSSTSAIVTFETNSVWVVMLAVSAVTFAAVLLLRRIINRPGGLFSALLLGLPLALPLVAALFFPGGLLPRVGLLRPVAPALRDATSSDLSQFVLLSDGRARLVVPYSLTDSPGLWILLLLVSVCVVMLARRMVGYAQMRRLMLRCAPPTSADGDVVSAVVSLSATSGLSVPPEVLFLPEGSTGVFTLGHRRPRILVSRDVVEYLDVDELKGVLAHEIAHIEARDPLLRLLAGLLRDVFVWNPIAHATYRRLMADRELEADKRAALLTGNPLAIASSIVKFCELVQGRSARSSRDALAFARTRERLGLRVKSLLALADEGVSLSSAPAPFVLAAALVAVLGLQAGARIADHQQAAFAIVWGAPSTESTRIWRSNRDVPKFSGGRLVHKAEDATNRIEKHGRRERTGASRANGLPGFARGLAVRERDWPRWVESMTQWAHREGLRTRALTAEATQSWLAVPVLPEPSVGSLGLYRIEPSYLGTKDPNEN